MENQIIDELEHLKLIVKELEEKLKGLENEYREHLLREETETT
jgi:hypothetical protein